VEASFPNFFVIGAAKSGTTSLHHYLGQHPDVFVSLAKEPRFFAFHPEPAWEMAGPRDAEWLRTSKEFVVEEDAYRAMFAGACERARGESSVVYLDTPVAAERIAARVPDARIIALLRDPADRAWSQYLQNRRYGLEPYTLRAALAVEEERIAAGWAWRYLYRSRSLYHRNLQPWLRHFPPERILVLLTEDLADNPRSTLARAFAFLGVDPAVRVDTRVRHNQTRHRRGRLRRPPHRPLDPALRREMIEDFRDDVLALQDLLGRDLSRWLRA